MPVHLGCPVDNGEPLRTPAEVTWQICMFCLCVCLCVVLHCKDACPDKIQFVLL